MLQQAVVGETPVEIDGGPVEIAPDQRVRIGDRLRHRTSIPGANLAPGDWTTLTLSFASAGTTTLDLLVVSPGDEYAIAPGDAVVSASRPRTCSRAPAA